MFARARPPVFAAAALVLVLINILMQPPWRAGLPSVSLDPSWQMVVLHAAAHGWQFGKDIVFTYGPLGFIMSSQYDPELYGLALTFWVIFYGTLAAALCVLYRAASPAKLIVLLLVGVVSLLNWAHDGIWFGACFVLFLLARRGERVATGFAAALTILIAVTALMKTTSLLLALPAIVLTDAARYARFRTLPLFIGLFGVTFLGAYLAADQSLGSLGAYLVNALEVSRGYGEAMHTYGSLREVALFALAGSLLFGLVAFSELRRRSRLDAVLAMAVTAGVLFVAAKAGFVRHDTGHIMIPWVAFMVMAAAYLGEISDVGVPALGLHSAVLGAAVLGAVMCCATYVAGIRETVGPGPAAGILFNGLREQMTQDPPAAAQVMFGGRVAQYKTAYESELAHIRKQSPPLPLDGAVDIFGVNQGLVVASGADYRPRPVFQSYSVYTPRLIGLNRAAITGPRAPDTILFEIDTVDNRYPALDEGALWPDLFRLYDVTGFADGFALLKRRSAPRAVDLQDLTEATIAFGQDMDASPWADGLLWMEMDIRPTLLGRLRSFLFKPPLLMLTVTTDAGNTQTFRIAPGLTASGFLLSPLIETTDQFALLPAREETIARFSVAAIGRPAGMFDDVLRVRLKRLRIEGDNETPANLDGTTLARLRTLRTLAASAGATPGQTKPPIYPDGKMLAHATSRLFLPVPDGTTTLTVGYGILDGAWAEGRDTDGACFRISAGETVLHDVCLDPKRVSGDRGHKTLTAALPDGARRVVFETLPRASTDWDWTYWSEVQFR